ncbi:MAG: glycosyltransferase family 2 protein [Planctomycetes bacterium]|nr:glycosyltransferase family 2 protein [Planctomycetota bacterium]
MTNVIALSICIPTYRMGAFLPKLLDSILTQLEDDVEICISNNGSDDDTDLVIGRYATRFRNWRYFRWPQNMGIDLNIEKSVELATGPWCWLMGSDDVIAPNSLRLVKERLQSATPDCDIILANRRKISVDAHPIESEDEQWFPSYADGDIVSLRGSLSGDYYSRSPSLGCVFSYLSTIVLRKSAWMAAEGFRRFQGNQYMHTARLVAIVEGGSRLMICKHTIVHCRYCAIPLDRTLDRLLVDFRGFHEIGEALVPDPTNRKLLWSILVREHPFRSFIRLRELATDDQWKEIRRLLRSLCFSRWRILGIVVGARWVRVRSRYYLIKHHIKMKLRGLVV